MIIRKNIVIIIHDVFEKVQKFISGFISRGDSLGY
jgi:hypothetical protein